VIVRVDPASPIPPYEQLRAQVAASIVGGHLAEGHQLPPIRQLAADLDLAPGTVARAYRELEAAGLVISRGRRGTRVAGLPADNGWDEQLVAAAQRYAEVAHGLGASVDDALSAAHAALAGDLDRSGSR
jgi:GntR family transcriptional regulator